MHNISLLSPREYESSVDRLGEILADAVEGGASVGFVQPFDGDFAAAWWRSLTREVARESLLVWVCRDGSRIVGTVSLALEGKPNGMHRGAVVKMIVHREARGRGLARELLATVERAAADRALTLLLLDTETGSAAEQLYQSAGWTCYGIVPDYATDPQGVPRDCSFFYKTLK